MNPILLRLRALAAAVVWLAFVGQLSADETGTLAPELEPLRGLLGRTYVGEFSGPGGDKPVRDVQLWERALNGQAVRVLHSINDGAYGGESLIMWDPEQKSLVFFYFTTAGFRTTGTVTLKDGKMLTHEKVTGSGGGVTEVRGTTELLPAGGMRVKTEYFKPPQWGPGRDVTYRPDPAAKVIFK